MFLQSKKVKDSENFAILLYCLNNTYGKGCHMSSFLLQGVHFFNIPLFTFLFYYGIIKTIKWEGLTIMYESCNKIRLLRLWEILKKETDEEHPMGTGTIYINSKICVV